MPSSMLQRVLSCAAILVSVAVYGQDLHIKSNISVGGYLVSGSDTSIKGSRERTVTQSPTGNTVTIRQCDLQRTVTLNEHAQTYLVTPEPQDENAVRAAALATGTPLPKASGGKVTITSTITDTGERKTMYGYQVRHLKVKVDQEPSADACTKARQTFEIDGWFADISKEQSACAQIAPPVHQTEGCHDTVISKRSGSGKLGYPLVETIATPAPDGTTTKVTIQTSELTKQKLPAELFDVPPGYRQVKSLAELNGAAQGASQQAGVPAGAPQFPAPHPGQGANDLSYGPAMANQAMPVVQQMTAQYAGKPGMMPNMTGMPGQNQVAGAAVAAPQALGPKAPGKIRIGVAPPGAQVGQGTNAGVDYSTPIRNAEVVLMSGPAVEIAALDSHVPMQLQAEAQQKQCDYILFSNVEVKHSSGGGFGRFMKMAGPMASVVPMVGMAGGMGGAVAAQAAGTAASVASQQAQQQAMSQLAGLNGQIKSKDDVSMEYQLVATGTTSPLAQNTLKGKAKSNGEDVLTPLLAQAATEVLNKISHP